MMRFAYLCNKEKHACNNCGTVCGDECNHTFLQEFAANPEAVEIARKFETYFEVSSVVGDDVYFEERADYMKIREMLDTEWTIVLFRNGRLGIVMKHEKSKGLRIFGYDEYGLAVSPAGITKVIDYNENLCFEPGDDDKINRKYDIMAIRDYRYHLPPSLTDIKKILFGSKDPSEIVWDWKREEVKEVTMADIEKAFGCKVKIVKGGENE